MKGYVLEEQNQSERRQFQRFPHAEAVRFQFKDPSQFGNGLSCDLSGGGIRVRLSNFVPLGAKLALKIYLSDRCIVDCTSHVAWVEKDRFGEHFQVGLEFEENGATLGSQKKIHELLSSL